jgi:photosystem II stability/assembly factor-like uncharacterized protein
MGADSVFMKRPAVLVVFALISVSCNPQGHPTSRPSVRATTASVLPAPGATDLGLEESDSIVGLSFVSQQVGFLLESLCGEADCSWGVRGTTDGGRHWRELASRYGEVSAIHFGNARDGWVSSAALHATHNGGRTWTDAGFGVVTSVQQVGRSVWAVLAEDCGPTGAEDLSCAFGLQSSSDHGRTWQSGSELPLQGSSAQLLRIGSSRAWIVAWGNESAPRDKSLIRTDDGGRTWTALDNPCGGSAFGAEARIDAPSRDRLWLLCARKPNGSTQKKLVFTSDDAGLHWHLPLNAPEAGTLDSFDVVSDEVAFLSLPGSGVWRTTDGSQIWRTVLRKRNDAMWGPIQFVDAMHGWVAYGSVVYRTADGGHRWSGVRLRPFRFA